jgi:hypothetical protein
MNAPQVYLMFNELVEGAVAPQPTIIHGGLIADFFLLAGIPGMAELRLVPELNSAYVVSCATLPDHDDMLALLRAEVPAAPPLAVMITPAARGCRIIETDARVTEQAVPSALKAKSLELQGHRLVRVPPSTYGAR